MRSTLMWQGLLAVLGCLASPCRADEAPAGSVADYRLNLALAPAAQSLRVTATLRGLPCAEDRLVLHLNRLFTLDAVEVDGAPVSPVLDPPGVPQFWLSAARNIALPCPRESVRLQYHGAGALSGDGRNQVTSQLIELSFYGGWYPIAALGQRFRWTLNLPLPPEARFATNARRVRAGNRVHGQQRWQLLQPDSDGDIAIVASSLFETHLARAAGVQVSTLIGRDRPVAARKRAAALGGFAANGLQALVHGLGTPSPEAAQVRAKLVFSRRDGPLSYARLPMVVMPQTVLEAAADPGRPVELNVLHELAHFWSRARAAEDDWLNEGLAEYLALRQFARGGHAAAAEAIRDEYRARAAKHRTGHSILQAGNADEETVNRYFKPALLFDALERQTTPAAMQALLRAALAPRTTLTHARMEALVSDHLGAAAATTFRQCLAALAWPAVCGGRDDPPALQVVDLMPEFWSHFEAVDANPASADAEWQAFATPHAALFAAIPCPPLNTGRWPAAQGRDWIALAAAMRGLSGQMAASLPGALSAFRRAFPDFDWGGKVYVMPSALCFDGRAQDVAGEPALLFGIDTLAATRNTNPPALVQHELFHLYHRQFFQPATPSLWARLWREGLATFATRSLNPAASEAELLLPPPLLADVQRDRRALASAFLRVADESGTRAETLYFQTDDRTEPVPPRAGYALSLLVAEWLSAQGHELATLARWDAVRAETEVKAALRHFAEDEAP